MLIEFDAAADALYIEVLDGPVHETSAVDDETMVDLTESGEVVGIEVLRPDREWLPSVLARFGDRLPAHVAAGLVALTRSGHRADSR